MPMPASATFEVQHAVEIEAQAPGVLFVTSTSTVPLGERLRLDCCAMPGEETRSHDVLAVRRHAAIAGGRLVTRVELRSVDRDRKTAAGVAVSLHPPVAAVLVRRIAVRLLGVHEAGCTFDSPAAVGEGVIGALTVIQGVRREVAMVRCERSHRTQHHGPWRTDAWFLPGARLAPSAADAFGSQGASGGLLVGTEASDGH